MTNQDILTEKSRGSTVLWRFKKCAKKYNNFFKYYTYHSQIWKKFIPFLTLVCVPKPKYEPSHTLQKSQTGFNQNLVQNSWMMQTKFSCNNLPFTVQCVTEWGKILINESILIYLSIVQSLVKMFLTIYHNIYGTIICKGHHIYIS